jgi:prepilin-type N-terminal cleavage/methylation domain-containing protein
MKRGGLNRLKAIKSRLAGKQGPHGFTLLEVMLAMGIASVVMAAIYGVYITQTRSYTTQNVSADVQQQVRAAIDFMAEDIMMAGLNPSRLPGVGILTAATDLLRFSADRDIDGAIVAASEDITYFLSGNQLMQRLGNNSATDVPLLDNVADLRFTYSNSGYADLIAAPGFEDSANPGYLSSVYLSNILSVAVSITVQEPAGRGGPVARTYTTRVRCRNIGLN